MRSLLAVGALVLPLLAGCSASTAHGRAAAPISSTTSAPAPFVSGLNPPSPTSAWAPTLTTPAGCQPSMPTTTVRVASAAMSLTLFAYCEDVWTDRPQNASVRLRFTQALQTHINEVLANLRPTESVDPPKDSSLLIQLFTPTNAADTAQKSIAGTVTVTQDGIEIGSKRLADVRSWTLPLRQGTYRITADAAGYRCNTPQIIRVYGHEQTGPTLSCKPA